MATDLATHIVDSMSRVELIDAFRSLNAENAKLFQQVADVRELAKANQHRKGDLAALVLAICNR